MTSGTVQQHPALVQTTHFRAGRIFWTGLLLLLLMVAGAAAWLYFMHPQQLAAIVPQDTLGFTLVQQDDKPGYSQTPLAAEKPVVPVDPYADRWAAIDKQLAQIHADMQAMKQQPKPAEKPAGAPVIRKHRPMVGVTHTEPAKKEPSLANTYLLAPGSTKIACQVETVVNSDTGETFTAVTTTPIYDTATGMHLLVPQGSTILGAYNGTDLLYGNQRLPTISLSLSLPNGDSVPLDEAPVTDQVGTSGLVSEVDQHYWRLVGAVFIGGALRGGALAMQTAAVGNGVPGAIGAGIAQSGTQVIQSQQGRALDTRPTIKVHAGELCQIILHKPLRLAAF